MSIDQAPATVTPLPRRPRIVPRSDHCISRSDISANALKVLYRLNNAGFRALLVGGGVRDLLLGKHPKDFDVATDARPEQVRELFRNCRLIGRRFRLAHVFFGSEIVEVATFRTHHGSEPEGDALMEGGRILRDNVYGSIDDDAWRRDFTVNALYYDIADFSVVDYVGGLADLEARRLRVIGDADERYREDPVRMLRAVRFAAKLGFEMEARTEQAIARHARLLEQIPGARLFEEIMKLFLTGHARASYAWLRRYALFALLFPQPAESLAGPDAERTARLLERLLADTDQRHAEDKPVNPAFLFAGLLWRRMLELTAEYQSHDLPERQAIGLAADAVISRQIGSVAVPRRLTAITREIWALQPRFARREGKRAERLAAHPRFRAAYDFLLLRSHAGEPVEDLARWWTEYQQGRAPAPVRGAPARRRPRRRRPRAPARRGDPDH
jgi:poly(A) polymerase